jgi:hypothetical protein
MFLIGDPVNKRERERERERERVCIQLIGLNTSYFVPVSMALFMFK